MYRNNIKNIQKMILDFDDSIDEYEGLKLISYLKSHYGKLKNVPAEVVINLLCKAAEDGALDILKFLHQKYQVDLNSYSDIGLTPLHYVVIGDHCDSIEPERKQAEAAQYLLDNNADLYKKPVRIKHNYDKVNMYDSVVIGNKSPLDIVKKTEKTWVEKIIGRTGSLLCDADRVRPVFEEYLKINSEKSNETISVMIV